MKGMDLFCVSQAATSVHLASIDSHASSSSSTAHLGSSRLLDRHNPIITDPSRATNKTPSSAPPTPFTSKNEDIKKSKKKNKKKSLNSDFVSSMSCAKGGGFISPSSSTRFLLGERTGLLEGEPIVKPGVSELPDAAADKMDKFDEIEKKFVLDGSPVLNQASSPRSSDQVVVLRVSLHCKGCAGKVKKYISRMQGVTSFNIDFAAKKITVVGNVTPVEVLASISKVKTAKLWTPINTPSISSTTPSIYSEISKSKAVVA